MRKAPFSIPDSKSMLWRGISRQSFLPSCPFIARSRLGKFVVRVLQFSPNSQNYILFFRPLSSLSGWIVGHWPHLVCPVAGNNHQEREMPWFMWSWQKIAAEFFAILAAQHKPFAPLVRSAIKQGRVRVNGSLVTTSNALAAEPGEHSWHLEAAYILLKIS